MRLYVPLTRQEFEALQRAALAERRRPQDQAATMLAKALIDEQAVSRPVRNPESEMTSDSGEESNRVLA